MSDDTYEAIIRGFDVLVESSDSPDTYHVTVSEQGGIGWEVDIPVNLDEFEGENETLDGSDAILDYVSKAAVDLFESQRGTLGEGAGALEVQAMKNKRAYYVSMDWEDWLWRLKGTPFEQEACEMLGQLFEFDLRCSQADAEMTPLYMEEAKLHYDLNVLNLERMKKQDGMQTVIVIQAEHRHACWGMGELEDYLNAFVGCSLERDAISKLQELLDIRENINMAGQKANDLWDERFKLEHRMNDLLLTAMQQNIEPLEGPEAAPNMTQDIMELMNGVDLFSPIAAKWAQAWGDEMWAQVEADDAVIQALVNMGYDELQATQLLEQYNAGGEIDPQAAAAVQEAMAATEKVASKVAWFFEDMGKEAEKLSLLHPLMDKGYGDWIASQVVAQYYKGDELDAQTTLDIEEALQDVQKVAFRYLLRTEQGDVSEEDLVTAAFHKTFRRRGFEEAEEVEERIEELGDNREKGLDPGLEELHEQQSAWNTNEYAQTNKELQVPFGWGGKQTIPKGTKGYAETLWDKHGDYILFRIEEDNELDGQLIKVRWDDLKSVKKKRDRVA